MHEDGQGKDGDRERLVAAIEEEIVDILVRQHGMDGVQVRLDRQTGDVLSSQVIPDHLKGTIMAEAAKRAIIKRFREE